MRILVSGVSSGLGRHLHEMIGGRAVTRADDVSVIASETDVPFDAIIHCAVNSAKAITADVVNGYVDDNLGMTRKLTKVPHRLFVYISTVDLYPSEGGPYDETFAVAGENLLGAYRVTKFAAEACVRQHCPRHLVIRPTTMVGRYARPMTLTRLARNPTATLFLSADSLYNIVSHDQVAAFINAALERSVTGIFNIASADYLRLGDVSKWLGAAPNYGEYLYKVSRVKNEKACEILPELSGSSRQVLFQHLNDVVFSNGGMPAVALETLPIITQ